MKYNKCEFEKTNTDSFLEQHQDDGFFYVLLCGMMSLTWYCVFSYLEWINSFMEIHLGSPSVMGVGADSAMLSLRINRSMIPGGNHGMPFNIHNPPPSTCI